MFGSKWQEFVEAYAGADIALMRSGKAPRLLAADDFPEAVKTWSGATKATTGDYPADETDWIAVMGDVWARVQADVAASVQDLNAILDKDWARRGRGGLVCLVLGMKWWRISIQRSMDEGSLKNWDEALGAINDVFKVISGLPSL